MTLSLHKIELFNFRSHEHFIFEPDLDGITAISGHNGSGKSTIVDGFAWALYGTRPSKVTNKMLIREGVSTKDNEVKVIIDISINKIDYRIIRRIVSDSGATDCNVYGKSGENEYNILAGPAVSSAEAYIKQIMGMDEKGFLTSILIQQKQVDQIVSASPRERAAVIEKLTGISSITEAIDLSRAETKAYQRAANVITVQDSQTIKAEIEEIFKQARELKETIANQKSTLGKNNEVIKKMKLEYDSNVKDFNEAEEFYNQRQLLKQNEKMLNDEARRITEELSKFKKSNSSSMIITDPAPIKKEYYGQVSTYLRDEATFKALKEKIENEKQELLKNKDLIDNKQEILSQIPKVQDDITQTKKEINDLKDKVQIINSNKKQAKKSLSTISTGDMVCPVCKRPIDNPEDLVNELNEELSNLSNNEKEYKKTLKTTQQKLEQLTNTINELSNQQEQLINLEEIQLNIPKQTEELKTSEVNLMELKSKVDVLKKNYNEAMKAFSYKEEIDNKKARLEEINGQLGSLNRKINEFNNGINKIHPMKKSEINESKRILDSETKTFNELMIQFNQNKSNYKYLQTRYKDLRAQYEEAVKAQKKYDELTSLMKTTAVSTTVMSDFKVDRIKFAVPTIEMYASTILAQFTDSKFTQLKLDGKFNASVMTSEGDERPIAQLSGGELSAAAIALRLSISMLLNGAEKNVIIFDEVLVSMDEVRARKIMETISSVTNSQIVFIAHNSDIDSVADLVVQVGKENTQED